jgi:hypothetical protein
MDWATRSVLNIGAGTGSYEPAGREVTAVEPSAEMIAQRPAGAAVRVARRRVLILNSDPELAERFWLTRDYLPGFIGLIPERYRRPGYWEQELRDLLGTAEAQTVSVPHDCHDGFYQAYWRRPRAYLDSEVRDGISVFHHLPRSRSRRRDGASAPRPGRRPVGEATPIAVRRSELDVGLRLVVSELRP